MLQRYKEHILRWKINFLAQLVDAQYHSKGLGMLTRTVEHGWIPISAT
jgi:hypothetical protein